MVYKSRVLRGVLSFWIIQETSTRWSKLWTPVSEDRLCGGVNTIEEAKAERKALFNEENISDVCLSEEGSPVWKDRSIFTYGSRLTISLIFFLFSWIKYLTFYVSKVLFLRCLQVILFYKFDLMYEKVSIRPQGSILKPKAQDSFSIT